MHRLLLAFTLVSLSASVAQAQLFHRRFRPAPPATHPKVQEVPPRPLAPPPAVGLAAVNSPFWFGPDYGIGGPGYLFRGYPPFNGWSSGHRGAYYGPPAPSSTARPRR